MIAGYVSVRGFARMIGVSPATASKKVARGEVPALRHSAKCVRIKVSDVEAYIAKHKCNGPQDLAKLEDGRRKKC